jgi:thiol-disulfide isomerase/thioredoxin
MNVKLCVRALLCLVLTYLLSFTTIHGQALRVGDTIPDELWDIPLQVVNHPSGKHTITLAEYKDKLIILDFWATWCGSCIKAFPKMTELQSEFIEEVVILPVTQESEEVADKFLKSNRGEILTNSHRPILVNDTVLKEYFPHSGIPHLVWINTNGKFFNTTLAEDLTAGNIKGILEKRKTSMQTKVDLDRTRPLFLSEHFSGNMKLINYSIFAKGAFAGLSSGTYPTTNSAGKVYGRQMTNLPLMTIYYPIAYEIFKENKESFSFKRVKYELKDPAQLHLIKLENGEYSKDNLYNFQMIVPESLADSLNHYMLADLNRSSPYHATIEKQNVDCLALIRTSQKDKIKSKGTNTQNSFPQSPSILSNRPIGYMLIRLNGDNRIDLPIIDETGYSGMVDIEVPGFSDLEELKYHLRRYDLDIVPAKRDLNMFVIRDK